MIISHKPFKHLKGFGQKKIEQFKSKEEYKIEITALEESRYKHYIDFLKDLQLIDLDKKDKLLRVKSDKSRDKIIEEHIKKKEHSIASYNEIVHPIDKKLHSLRIEILQHFPYKPREADKRL